MTVGCLIYTDSTGKVYHRLPCWPWPSPGVYPIQHSDGTWIQFFPHNYLRFSIGNVISPFPPVPYIPQEKS